MKGYLGILFTVGHGSFNTPLSVLRWEFLESSLVGFQTLMFSSLCATLWLNAMKSTKLGSRNSRDLRYWAIQREHHQHSSLPNWGGGGAGEKAIASAHHVKTTNTAPAVPEGNRQMLVDTTKPPTILCNSCRARQSRSSSPFNGLCTASSH